VTLSATPDPEVIEQFVNACHSNFDTVQRMLDADPSLLNVRSKVNESGLEGAAHMGHRTIAEFLLGKGAPLDLCTAVMLGRQDEVREMIAASPDVSGAMGAHRIPVMTFAAINGSLEIAELLFSHGAVVNAEPDVVSPLHMAVFRDRPDMVAWLVERHASLTALFSGMTPLQMAEQQKRERVLAVLQKHIAS